MEVLVKHSLTIEDILSYLQGYPNLETCILGTEHTNFIFYENSQTICQPYEANLRDCERNLKEPPYVEICDLATKMTNFIKYVG